MTTHTPLKDDELLKMATSFADAYRIPARKAGRKRGRNRKHAGVNLNRKQSGVNRNRKQSGAGRKQAGVRKTDVSKLTPATVRRRRSTPAKMSPPRRTRPAGSGSSATLKRISTRSVGTRKALHRLAAIARKDPKARKFLQAMSRATPAQKAKVVQARAMHIERQKKYKKNHANDPKSRFFTGGRRNVRKIDVAEIIEKYNKNHSPANGRFTSGSAGGGGMKGGPKANDGRGGGGKSRPSGKLGDRPGGGVPSGSNQFTGSRVGQAPQAIDMGGGKTKRLTPGERRAVSMVGSAGTKTYIAERKAGNSHADAMHFAREDHGAAAKTKTGGPTNKKDFKDGDSVRGVPGGKMKDVGIDGSFDLVVGRKSLGEVTPLRGGKWVVQPRTSAARGRMAEARALADQKFPSHSAAARALHSMSKPSQRQYDNAAPKAPTGKRVMSAGQRRPGAAEPPGPTRGKRPGNGGAAAERAAAAQAANPRGLKPAGTPGGKSLLPKKMQNMPPSAQIQSLRRIAVRAQNDADWNRGKKVNGQVLPKEFRDPAAAARSAAKAKAAANEMLKIARASGDPRARGIRNV